MIYMMSMRLLQDLNLRGNFPLDFKSSTLTTRSNRHGTPSGTWTHNLEIRSLARYPIAPSGQSILFILLLYLKIADEGFDPPTFGLWAQYATSAPTR